MTDQIQPKRSPPARRRGLAVVFLVIGVVIGGGLVAVWMSPRYSPPAAAPAAQAAAPDEITEAIRDLQAGQQKNGDQLQAIQQALASDQAQMKQLSGEIAAVSDKLESLRKSFAGSPQAVPTNRRRRESLTNNQP